MCIFCQFFEFLESNFEIVCVVFGALVVGFILGLIFFEWAYDEELDELRQRRLGIWVMNNGSIRY